MMNSAAGILGRSSRASTLLLSSLLLLVGGCNKPTETSKKPAELSAPQPPAETKADEDGKPSAEEARKLIEKPLPQEAVAKVVNPKGQKAYAGPTGTVIGTVRVTGDASPAVKRAIEKMEANCTAAKPTFGQVTREGAGRTLADVLVAVTGYEEFVPQKEESVVVRADGCAWNTRTIALTFGQSVSVAGLDNRAYAPELMGQAMPAQLMLLPGSAPVKIPPRKPGRYRLVDSLRLYNVADVFVLPYATVDVTSLDGKFSIEGVPVGTRKVNALLPVSGVTKEVEVEVVAGESVTVDFELPFDASIFEVE